MTGDLKSTDSAERSSRFVLPHARFSFVIGVAVVILSLSFFSFRSRHGRSQSLAVDDRSLDFGNVWASEHFRWVLPIRNTSGHEVLVNEVKASCRCVALNARQLRFKPGELRDIELSINLLPRTAETKELSDSWPFSARLLPDIQGSLVPSEPFEIKGRVHRAYKVSKREVRFPTTPKMIAGRPFPAETVVVEPAVSVAGLLAVTSGPPVVDVRVSSASRPNSFLLELVPRPALAPGRFECVVTFRPKNDEGHGLPPANLRVSGIVSTDVQVVPDLLSFAPAQVSSELTRSVVLRSESSQSFLVTSVSADEPDTWVLESNVPSAGYHAFDIHHRVAQSGEIRRLVRFRVRDSVYGEYDVTLPIVAVGLPTTGAQALDSEKRGTHEALRVVSSQEGLQ